MAPSQTQSASADAPTPPASEGSPSADAIEITLRNACPEPVDLMFGASARDQSLTLPAGESTTRTVKPHERVFVLDGDGSPGQSASLEGAGGEIVVLDNCRSLRATERGSLGEGGPSTEALQEGLRPAKLEARQCVAEAQTSATVRVALTLVISGSDGRVIEVTPTGEHASSALGRCVAKAFTAARFEPFEKSEHHLDYELVLRQNAGQ